LFDLEEMNALNFYYSSIGRTEIHRDRWKESWLQAPLAF
jgi:hypothetical protein